MLENLKKYNNYEIEFKDLREIEKILIIKRDFEALIKQGLKETTITKQEFIVVMDKINIFNKYIKNSFKVVYCDIQEENVISVELKEL